MKHVISKRFEFEFAHRVPTQNIIKDLCYSCTNKCRKIHGHTGQIEIFLEAEGLDETGMVTDYTNLKWFKNMIVDTYFDHKLILSTKYDTLWRSLIRFAPKIFKYDILIFRPKQMKIKILSFNDKRKLIKFLSEFVNDYELTTLHVRIPKNIKAEELKQEMLDYKYLLESFTLINNYTTAESLAAIIKTNLSMFYTYYFNPKYKQNISVKMVCFYETQKSSACV